MFRYVFTMYTNDCQINTAILKILKFADDSSIIASIRSPEDETAYTNCINDLPSGEWTITFCLMSQNLKNL